MEKIFILKGLDCPNCAAKIESEVQKIEGIAQGNINLMKQSLTVRLDPDCDAALIYSKIHEIVKKHEPDVEVIAKESHSTEHSHDDDGESPYRLHKLVTGAVIAVLTLVFYYAMPGYELWSLTGFVPAYLLLGGDVLLRAGRNILHGRVFDENFLMALATLGAFAIQEFPEAVAVMLLYQIGEYFQDRAVNKSRKSIQSLLEIRPDRATVMHDGEWRETTPDKVLAGERILVKPGERIPLDGKVIEGVSRLDMRALTGESVPKSVHPGEDALSGCVNQESMLTIEVTRAFAESTASRIVEMVENASVRKAPAENFITRFARYYTPVVVILAVLTALILPLGFGFSWADALTRAFVCLVISCPCALVISIPLTYFGGIGAASRSGILVKGSNYLDVLRQIDTVVFDKTGTLTCGTFEVTYLEPAENISEQELLEGAAKAEIRSNHPIARSILNICNTDAEPDEYIETSGQGTKARYGADTYFAGNKKLMEAHHLEYSASQTVGTHVYVARNHRYLGCITISDKIKQDSGQAIRELKELGIRKTVMLTGDTPEIAQAIANELKIDEVKAGLMPADKLKHFEEITVNACTAFVGDGINDAPVLARADAGIAMGALGSDAAIEAADIVLMSDAPSQISEGIRIARCTHAIAIQNIVFALGVKILLLILGAIGVVGLWLAILGDVGVMILAVMNAMRMMRK